jgi:hypothetical protein
VPHHIRNLLADLGIKPVLVDIGASGEPPPIWNEIAAHSTYIGFDPDAREIHRDRLSQYHSSVIINQAVTGHLDRSMIPFYLTKSPFCSTTLGPHPEATAHWLERDKFLVESETTLSATTIDAALTRQKLSMIDWIKLDTQGTDLRLIHSISSPVLSRVMAIDTEPGLIEIYQGEDMFVDVHRDLTSNGFWLSGLQTGGFRRMRRTTLEEVQRANTAIDDAYIERVVRTSPAYFEARYLRTLEWLAAQSLSPREYLLLWIFALVDRQLGFALDVNAEVERRFGVTNQSKQLKAATWQLIRSASRRYSRCRVVGALTRRLRSVIGRAPGIFDERFVK